VAATGDPAAAVRALLEPVAEALGLDARLEVSDDGEVVVADFVGDDLGLLIGRHGQTIDALQHLAWRVIGRTGATRERVVIDASGYRARREETLAAQADEAADQAMRFDRPVAMDAMSAPERKVVHEYLRERGDVETYSEGDEPDRHLVVAPLGD